MKKNPSNSKPPKAPQISNEEDSSNEINIQEPDIEIIQEAKEELGEENPLYQKILVAIQRRSYEGPIPHSEEMAKYEKIMPGATDRIIGMAELHAKTSSKIADRDSETRASESRWSFILMIIGIIFAFIITCSVIVLAAYLMINDKTLEGLVTITIFIIALFALAFKSKVDMNILGMKFNSKQK